LIPVDVKVIATTTVDLANLVEQNRFSRQLYYALHSFEIVIPRCGRGVTVFPR
jgi:transcriptional regulator of acetoin/glycerol metabolism